MFLNSMIYNNSYGTKSSMFQTNTTSPILQHTQPNFKDLSTGFPTMKTTTDIYNKKKRDVRNIPLSKDDIIRPDIKHEDGPDMWWPPVPGLECHPEEADYPVGNLNKPPFGRPEWYPFSSTPTHKEISEQFLQGHLPPGVDFDPV